MEMLYVGQRPCTFLSRFEYGFDPLTDVEFFMLADIQEMRKCVCAAVDFDDAVTVRHRPFDSGERIDERKVDDRIGFNHSAGSNFHNLLHTLAALDTE